MKNCFEKDVLFDWKDFSFLPKKGYRQNDPITSKKAYEGTKFRHNSQSFKILHAYYDVSLQQEFPTLGLTDEEAGEQTGLIKKPRCCYWKRCSELRQMSLIIPNGEHRRSSANEDQAVCIITLRGIEAIKKLSC